MILPSTSPQTLGFNSTEYPYSVDSPHKGVDFAYIPDNRIYAPFSGTVQLIPNNGRDGDGIYMYNGNQFHGLLHTSQYLVKDGQQVTEGQVIGIMGNSGFAQGVHLHWCVKVNGVFIDPLTLLDPANLTKGETDMIDSKDKAIDFLVAVLHRTPQTITQEDINSILNQPYSVAVAATFKNNSEWRDQNDKLVAYSRLLASKTAGSLTPDQQKGLDALEAFTEYINAKV